MWSYKGDENDNKRVWSKDIPADRKFSFCDKTYYEQCFTNGEPDKHVHYVHRMELVLQQDGNLVLYRHSTHPDSPHAVWDTGTNGNPDGQILWLQNDGSLSLRLWPSNVEIWSSYTGGRGNGPYTVEMPDVGFLTIKDKDSKKIWTADQTMSFCYKNWRMRDRPLLFQKNMCDKTGNTDHMKGEGFYRSQGQYIRSYFYFAKGNNNRYKYLHAFHVLNPDLTYDWRR